MSKASNKDKNKKEGVDKPHDFLFKNTFCNKEAMLDFLSANLPSDLFSKIDQEKLELTNKSFVDPVGRRGESDLVFKTNINGKEGYLYILSEHVRHEVTQRESAPSALGPHQSPIVTSLVRLG